MTRDPAGAKVPRGDRAKWRVDANGCRVWVGAVSGSGTGYGYIRDGARVVRAHRYWYRREKGPIPRGKVLHHRCGNTRCVNPAHLVPMSQTRNRWYQARGQ